VAQPRVVLRVELAEMAETDYAEAQGRLRHETSLLLPSPLRERGRR
jgi:hypothetical protein